MKKVLSKILALALVFCLSGAVSLFAACGNDNGDGGAGSASVDYEHTIVFYSSQGDNLQKITANAISSFEKKYPNWKVQHTKPGGYDEVRDLINSDLGSETQPDIAYCYPDHVAQYLKNGSVVNLDKYITSTETVNGNMIGFTEAELADFVPTFYEEGRAKNFAWKQYADLYPGMTDESMLTIPFVRSTELMYYNATALKACGLKPATTWDELWAQCDTLLKRFPKCTPLGYDSGANWFITMCKQNGWGYTSLDNNEHYLFAGQQQADWLQLLREYGPEGKKYVTTQEIYGAYTSGLFIKGVEEGGLVYCIGSSGGASHQNPNGAFEWGISAIPGTKLADETVNKSVISQGPSFVMFTGGNKVTNATEKEKMTFLFMKELLDPTFQAAFSIESGYNPVRLSTYEVEDYVEHLSSGNIVAEATKIAETMKDDFFISPAFNGSSEARDQAELILKKVMKRNATPKEALLEAYKNCCGKEKTELDQ